VLFTTLANVSFWSSRIAFTFWRTPLGLDLDVAGDEVAVLRVNRNLAGAEKQVADAHGVVVGADGGG